MQRSKIKGAPEGAPLSSIVNTIAAFMPLEPISKMWIRVQGKARFGEKAQHTR